MNMPLQRRKLIKASLLSLIVRIIGAVLSLFFMSVIARQLGVAESGLFFLAMNLILFISVVARVGLDNTVLRFCAAAQAGGTQGEARDVLHKGLGLSICSAGGLALICMLGSELIARFCFDKPELAEVIMYMSPAILGVALYSLIAMGLQGWGRITAAIFVLNIQVFVLALLLTLWVQPVRAAQVGGIFSMSALFTAMFSYLIWHKWVFRDSTACASQISWSKIFASCKPLWLVAIMGQLTQFSGLFVAAAWVAPEQLAQLATAQRMAMLISFVLIAVNFVVAPKFAALHKLGDSAGLQSLALYSVRLMLVVSLPLLFPILMFPELIMSFFGTGFSDGGYLLQIFAVGQFVNVFTGSVVFILSMSGNEKALRNCVLVSGPFAILMNLIFVPLWGALGCAVATALAITVQNLLAVRLVNKHIGFNTLAFWK
ncbi:oligosaccharide flippase family protein [Amphritea sp. HPY]|uniref:oligosaccharide flippase family protein n=1 Tax=Amphritea sp. HPY TaxID=3421652 RepID=UPI003D7E0F82